MKILIKLLPFIIIAVLSIFSFLPFLSSGFFPIHDDTQVARVYEMSKALRDGMFPVRWVSDLGYGYGYPIYNHYAPLSYYVGGFIGLLGIDALLATKLMMIIGIIFSGLFMYLLSREFWGRLGGILSAVLYLYIPYHALNIYVRGAVAEFWAYAFLPLLFYSIYKTYQSINKQKMHKSSWQKGIPSIILGGVSFAAIVLSHNLTALIVTPFALICGSFFIFKNKKISLPGISSFLSIFALGFLLSAFYSLPAILELKYTNIFSQVVGGSDYRTNFVCINQLWYGVWGFGGSIPGCIDGISFIIGKPHIFLTLATILSSLIFIFRKKDFMGVFEKEKEKFVVLFLSFIGFLVSIFLTLEVSKPIWDLLYPMKFLQYPWRFLMLIALFSSFISGGVFWILRQVLKGKKYEKYIYYLAFILILLLSFYSYLKYFNPQYFLAKDSIYYTNELTLKWTTSKISDEYMPKNFLKPNSPSEIPNVKNLVTKDIEVVIESNKTQEIKLKLNVYRKGAYILPIAYFPTWNVYLDGKRIDIKESKRGIAVDLPIGEHDLRIAFLQTKLEVFSNFLSLSGILIVLAGIILLLRRKYD